MSEEQSLQERYAPSTRCFGCGPANPDGLQIKSFVRGDVTTATCRGVFVAVREGHPAFHRW